MKHNLSAVSADVEDFLNTLLREATSVLGAKFVGMYLFGSLALGDFDPATSDIDFLVTTDGELFTSEVTALEDMHARLIASGSSWAKKLEGSYVPMTDLKRYRAAKGPYPCTNEGRFYMALLGSEWVVNLYILREYGIVFAGPPPHTFIAPVQPAQIRQAAQSFLNESGEYMVGRLADPGYQTYAVLTMCRLLYSVMNGTVASKLRAADWAKSVLKPRWSALIDKALETRQTADLDNEAEVSQFISAATDMVDAH